MEMSSFLCLILAGAFAVLAILSSTANGAVEISFIPSSISLAPASSSDTIRANMIRKLGKNEFVEKNFNAPCPNPSEAAKSEERTHFTEEATIPSHSQLSSTESKNDEKGNAQEQEFHLKKHHRSSIDKSVAGGGVILGGLATTFLVAVFCYIKATSRHKEDATV